MDAAVNRDKLVLELPALCHKFIIPMTHNNALVPANWRINDKKLELLTRQ